MTELAMTDDRKGPLEQLRDGFAEGLAGHDRETGEMERRMPRGGEGEQRLKRRRRQFWMLVAAGIGLGMAMGFVMGFMGGIHQYRPVSPLIIWPAVGVSLVLFVWYCAAYFRRIDELDLQDNLWAGMIGLYFYIVVLPLWFFLNDMGQLPQINHWVVWTATMIVTLATYGWRKWR